MNKTVKFHKPTGPAFNPGEIWEGSAGSKVKIISVKHFSGNPLCHGLSDYEVEYFTGEGENTNTKDCWNFQVRYNHSADKYVK